MSTTSSSSVQSQLYEINAKIRNIDSKVLELKEEKDTLLALKESLKDQCMAEKSKKLSLKDWSGTNFDWSSKMFEVMKAKFKISELRTLQLEAINATMSKQDVIVIMPTGGGKSLCYQLPALLSNGLTLVVSPLIALMEDQIAGLKRLQIDALILCATSSKDDAKKAADALTNEKSNVRLLYVTPERLAKSKRFMSQLQKCASLGRFARLAIDEVHCCSTWGHDFRPDYNYLGVLRDLFPSTPVIGLTATSTSKVTVDIQKMLNLQGALILRAPFNRPNLHYSVLRKPSSQEECADLIKNWLQNKFAGQTGIIYTTTIKDCESLATELKNRGIKVGVYHAMLETEARSRTHERWMTGSIQVIVATIAFGLGIDKPDVRFVIHHALSKSMEMLYQESGRAGRDGKPAHCIILFRLADVFKLSTMVFTQKTGIENLYGIVKYCLEPQRCRRSMIADYFDEVWKSEQCSEMCDHCSHTISEPRQIEVASHCRSLYRLISHAADQDRQLTASMLIDLWMGAGQSKLRLKDLKPPSVDRLGAEAILAQLLVQGYLKEDFHYTPYSTISYIRRGNKAGSLDDTAHSISIFLPKLLKDLPESSWTSLKDGSTKIMDVNQKVLKKERSSSDYLKTEKRKHSNSSTSSPVLKRSAKEVITIT